MLRHQSFPCATVARVYTSMCKKKTFPINKIILYIRLLEKKTAYTRRMIKKKIRLITILLIYWRIPDGRQFMIY